MQRETPFEADFQALRHAIVREAANPAVFDGMMLRVERVEQMLAVPGKITVYRRYSA